MITATAWNSYTPEQRAKYLSQQKAKREGRNQAKRRDEETRAFLKNFLNSKTLTEKRALAKAYNPFLYQFGYKLDPNNPYEENEDEQLSVNL